jgi:hypothetical protein
VESRGFSQLLAPYFTERRTKKHSYRFFVLKKSLFKTAVQTLLLPVFFPKKNALKIISEITLKTCTLSSIVYRIFMLE